MSGLLFLEKLNKRLDQGWKLSNVNCPQCKQTVVGHPVSKEFFCIKCDLPVKFEVEDEDMEVVDMVDTSTKLSEMSMDKTSFEEAEYDNMVLRNERRKRDDERSKKMGDLMLQGWAMLADVCEKCLVPIMRSKKGELLCVGCGPVGGNKPQQKPVDSPKKAEPVKKEEKIEVIKKEEVKKEVIQKEKEVPKEAPKKVSEPAKEAAPVKKEAHKKSSESQDLYSAVTTALIKEVQRVSNSETGDSLISRLEKIVSLQSKIDQMKSHNH